MQNVDRIHVQASSFWDNPCIREKAHLRPDWYDHRNIMDHGDHEPVTIRRPRKQSSQLGEIISHKHLWKMWQQKKELKKFHCCLPRQNPIGGISIRFHLLREVLLSSHGTQYPISYERPPANSRICSSRRSRSSQSNTGFEAWFLLKFSYFQAQIPDLVRILIFYCFNNWRFPEIGVPLNYPLLFSDFPLKKPSIWDALTPPVSIQASPSPNTSWPARTSRHRRAPMWRSTWRPGRGGKRPGAPGAAAFIHGKWICPIDSNRIFQHME